MFQINASREPDGIQTLHTLFQHSGLKQYPIVELPIDCPVLHINVLQTKSRDEKSAWSRYLCTNLATTLDIITQNTVSSAVVYSQISNPSDRSKFEFLRVYKIWEGVEPEGFQLLFYQCSNNQIYIDGLSEIPLLHSQHLRELWVDPMLDIFGHEKV